MGSHLGSALSPLIFIIIMDVLAEEARTKPPWEMLFAEYLVLVSETMEEVQEELERWRAVIENKGLRISRSKTEYLVPYHQQGVVKLEGEPLPLVYETGIKMLELTTRKGDKTPLYFSVSMMSIVHETVCWTSGKSSLTRVWRHFANGYHF